MEVIDDRLTLDEIIDYLKFRREQGYDLDKVIAALEDEERGFRYLTKIR